MIDKNLPLRQTKTLITFKTMNENKWTEDQVLEYFDKHWDCTLGQLSLISAWSVPELKKVLNQLVDHETNELF